MTQDNKNRFAAIVAQAQAKADGKKLVTAKPTQAPAPVKVVEAAKISKPEMSTVTVEDILRDDAPKSVVSIVDYSEKAFAVIGETKPIKDQLRGLGGSFNAHLKCGAGWIFSKKRLQSVEAHLQIRMK
jgi:hypothetical protein